MNLCCNCAVVQKMVAQDDTNKHCETAGCMVEHKEEDKNAQLMYDRIQKVGLGLLKFEIDVAKFP